MDSPETKPVITVYVSGGVVQAVYTSLPGDIEVNVIDFDNAKAESEEAVTEAEEQLETAEREQRMIY